MRRLAVLVALLAALAGGPSWADDTPPPQPPIASPQLQAGLNAAGIQSDSRVAAIRDRVIRLAALVGAIRGQFDSLQKESAVDLRFSQAQQNVVRLRDLRRQGRDALADGDRLLDEASLLAKTLRSEVMGAYFNVFNTANVQTPPLMGSIDTAEPQIIAIEDIYRLMNDNDNRVKELESLIASSSPENLANLRAELSFRKRPRVEETYLRRALTSYETQRAGFQQLTRTVADVQRLRVDGERLASEIEGAVSDMLNLNNQQSAFRQTVTVYFAITIVVLILGFFAVILMDSAVRGRVFGGDTGIQFVTLFSVVIAIILFGVMGILEGKELSALLGGLSGYILGRGVGAQNTGTQPPATTGPQTRAGGSGPGQQPAAAAGSPP